VTSDSKCGFEIAGDQPPYCGVRGYGIATLNKEKGEVILRNLIRKYLGDENNSLAKSLLLNRSHEVAVEIEPKALFRYDYSKRMDGITINTQPFG